MNRPPLAARQVLPRGAVPAALAALAAAATVVAAVLFTDTGAGVPRAQAGPHAVARSHSAVPAVAGHWVGSWAAAPAGAEPATDVRGMAGRSVRNVVHTSIGGTSARIQLSNLFGRRPLTIGHASLALAASPGSPAAAPGTLRRLAFGGREQVTIPAGQAVVSDPVRLDVPRAADVLVSTYSRTPSGPVTFHPHARQTSWLASGDHTQDAGGAAYAERTPYWRYVTALDVWSTGTRGAVVALGDSITDGVTATFGADHRWTDVLAGQLPDYGVLNEGISGNRVLLGGMGGSAVDNPSALGRFDRDVLARTGVRAVVVELGINDILRSPQQLDPARIVDGLRDLVRRAHVHGLRVIGSTLSPFGGHGGVGAEQERVRQGVNAAVRAGGVFDGVVDFDVVLRDPANPQRLLAAYDCGDHLHPNDAGYRAMAGAVDTGALTGWLSPLTRP
ncbi:SGNH/GDSL hydrolase family protein [Streptomyces sp. NPDC001262]|uniref:SGNH/GDSL hydrolase family protein n=1 Tax=unclassified Streptomyces TaxID=2593676 RepID=UPI0036846673